MELAKKAAHNIPSHGMFLFRHVSTGIQFMVEGAGFQYYFKHLRALDEGQWFYALSDIWIETSFDFTNYRVWVTKKEDVLKLTELLRDKESSKLSRPKIVISEGMTKALLEA